MDLMMKRGNVGFPPWYTLSFLGLFGILNTFSMCFNFNIMLVYLVKEPINAYNKEMDENFTNCPEILDVNATDEIKTEFTWDIQTQHIILESSFYGLCLTQLLAGIFSDVTSGKWPFGISVLVTAIACIFIPTAARINSTALIFVRVFQGMAAGIVLPSINTLLAKWSPKLERSFHNSIIFSGIPLSNIYTYITIGFLLKNEFFGGWSSVLYLQGTFSIVWFIFWSILIFESPNDHKFLTELEIQQLQTSQDNPDGVAKVQLSSYLECFILFGATAVFSYSSGIITDGLRIKGWFLITKIRKVMNSFAFFVPALCLILIPFVGCQTRFVFVLHLLANSFMGVASSGFQVTHIDMCPELAGILIAITGTFGSIIGCLAVLYNNFIFQTGHRLKSFKIIFCTSGAVLFISGIFFNFFADSEQQDWITKLKPKDEKTETSEEKE